MKNLKFYIGIALLLLSCLLPVLAFWVATLPLPAAAKATIIGAITVGGPDILAILAVSLLGKQAFDLITGKVLAALSRLAPHGSVGKARYKVGLVLFMLPVIPTYIMGYAPHLLPDVSPARLYVSVGSDVIFITSLFVLGGDFWDKLRALFVYDARVTFPRV